MSYLVLARKYRPRNFEQMVGQSHVVQALANALTQQRLHHAYLFTGTRGVGKTTVSRILAKSLNCTGLDGQGGITAQPCGQCQPCRDIDAGRFVDYVELDAASNRGVEEISQLLDQSVYKPVVGRFKVYMIDEVHMLSTTAFNAMLKTLEEPPEYLKFVLATTDPQKVPVTVLSRCLQFNLRPMAAQTVLEHLQDIAQAENIEAEVGALRLIARAARGSMRDALSLTDQAVAFAGGHLDEAGVRQMLGSVDRSHVVRLIEAIAAGDGAGLVQAVETLRTLGLSAAGALEDLAEMVQRMAVIQAVGAGAVDAADPDAALAARLAGLLAPDESQLLYSIALHGRSELALAPDEYGGLLMVLLRMLAFMPGGSHAARPDESRPGAAVAAPRTEAAVAPPGAHRSTEPESAVPDTAPARALQRPQSVQTQVHAAALAVPFTAEDVPPWVDAPETMADDAVVSQPSQTSSRALPTAETAAAPSMTWVEPPQFDDPLGDRWAELVGRLSADGAITALVRELAWQSQCLAVQPADGGGERWRLRVERETLRGSAHRERLEAAMAAALGHSVALEVEAGVAADSPAKRDAAEKEHRQRAAETLIEGDPLVVSLMRQFKTARIVPGSIKPI
jgi:DNA polymerase-3 subunit gamma/tau